MFWCSSCCSGRYNKFCRSLPQTPWVIDGERRMESSVEELIAAPVLSSFRSDGESTLWRSQHFVERDNKLTLNLFWWSDAGFNFSSSGREDVDVRTLGNGEDAYKYIIKIFLNLHFHCEDWSVFILCSVVFGRSSVRDGAAESSQIQTEQSGDEAAAGGRPSFTHNTDVSENTQWLFIHLCGRYEPLHALMLIRILSHHLITAYLS